MLMFLFGDRDIDGVGGRDLCGSGGSVDLRACSVFHVVVVVLTGINLMNLEGTECAIVKSSDPESTMHCTCRTQLARVSRQNAAALVSFVGKPNHARCVGLRARLRLARILKIKANPSNLLGFWTRWSLVSRRVRGERITEKRHNSSKVTLTLVRRTHVRQSERIVVFTINNIIADSTKRPNPRRVYEPPVESTWPQITSVATFAARNEYPGFSFRSPGWRTSSDSFSSHGCDSPCIGPMLIETHRPSMKHATIQLSNPLTSVVLITWPSRAFPSICGREKSSLRPQGSVGRMSEYRFIWMYFERQSQYEMIS